MSATLDFSKSLVVLAPLAGYTDLPFRSVVKKFGVDLTISEMISSNALVYNSKKTLKMLEKSANEDPYFIQLAGYEPKVISEAVKMLNDIDGIAGIDLNCGCPAPKVFNNGSGSNLLGDLPRLGEILSTIKKVSNKQYTTAKVRIGVNEKIPREIAHVVEDSGADMISVHGRTRVGAYKAPVDYDAIAQVKDVVKIPVIANGDIKDYKKAQQVLEYTHANGVMIGRGAIGKPWVFYQLKHGLTDEEISSELKKEIIIEHFEQMLQFYEEYGVVMFRKHLHTYSKGYSGAHDFREKVNKITDQNEARELIENFF